MKILGCDYPPGFQQIAFVDTETGELQERRLQHPEEAEKFYRDLSAQGVKVRVGMEASGHARWFERLLGELNFELWIGDAAVIRTKRVRKQKTDRQDAQLILQLMMEDRFPQIWVANWENRDLRQLLWHRSGASDGAQPAGMAKQVFSPGDATRAEDCESSDGPQVSHSAVLDDAQGMGLRAGEKIRSARGTTRTSPWCAVKHRVIDWVSPSSSRRSSN
jgi:Transposase